MKNKKNIIILVLIIFLILLVISAIPMYIFLNTKDKKVIATNENTTILKEPEKNIEEETEDTDIEKPIEEVEETKEIVEEQKEEPKPVVEEKTEEKKSQTVANTSKPKQQVSNNESKKTTETKATNKSEQKKEERKTEEKNNNVQQTITETPKTQPVQEQQPKEENPKVETHPELAFTGYVERNKDKEKIVINWLKDELSKSESAVKFGYTVQSGDVIESGTNGFSMVESRVRHRVQNSIGGNYYVQVKDQYMYNSDGTAVNLTDTLVYIWEEF